MAARNYWYSEALSRTTSTTTNYSTVKNTLTFTPNASKTYAIFWSVYLDGSSGTLLAKARLQNTTDTVTLNEQWDRPYIVTTQKHTFGGMAYYTSSASPASHTFEVQVASETASQTLGASECVLFVLELGANDITDESTGTTNSSTTSYAAKVTASWTPGSAGDYLIVCSMETQQSASGNEPALRIYNGTTAYSDINFHDWRVATNKGCYFGMAKGTNLSSAQTWTGEFNRHAGSGTSTVSNARILALRLSDFEASFIGEDRTSHNTTSTTYADAATVTGTPAAVDHILIACGNLTNCNSVSLGGNKVNAAGSDVGTIFSVECSDVTGWLYPWMAIRKRTEAASSTTWKTQYNRVSGAQTIAHDEAVIAVLQLDTSITGGITPPLADNMLRLFEVM